MAERVTILHLWAAVWTAELLECPSEDILAVAEELRANPFMREESPPDWRALDYCVTQHGAMSQVTDVNISAYTQLTKLLRLLK